ncbi:hypothetical protein DFH28DRAFT_900402 [Melampsora americana]|nr:hypothetical protein DFH28DRAFT_900402 [Melampsora americana]
MREIKETSSEAWVTCVINVQHNCHDSDCSVTQTKTYRVERTDATKKRPEVTHETSNSFIVNAGAHFSSEYHRHLTDHVWSPVTTDEWQASINEGLAAWFKRCPPKSLAIEAEDEAGPQADGELIGMTDSPQED